MNGHCEKYEEMYVLAMRSGVLGRALETKLITEGNGNPSFSPFQCLNAACDGRGLSDGVNFLYVCVVK
jgi:hypothetical protein